MAKVFAIPELLEAVLIKLPAKDLLLAQRVNTVFRHAMNNSIKIQRALFFKPDPAASHRNPFLYRIIDMNCQSDTHEIFLSLRITTPSDSTSRPWKTSDGPHLHVSLQYIQYWRPPKSRKERKCSEATASWRRMMATSDPAVPVYIEDAVFRDHYTECEAPLPMQELVAKLSDVFECMVEMHCDMLIEDGLHEYEGVEGDGDAVLEVPDAAGDDDEDANDPSAWAMSPSQIGEDEDYLAIEDEDW